jgi:hypothetical protein
MTFPIGDGSKITREDIEAFANECNFVTGEDNEGQIIIYTGVYLAHPDNSVDEEYQRGYQDGLDSFPVASNASTTYDAGYEDGQLDSQTHSQR